MSCTEGCRVGFELGILVGAVLKVGEVVGDDVEPPVVGNGGLGVAVVVGDGCGLFDGA